MGKLSDTQVRRWRSVILLNDGVTQQTFSTVFTHQTERFVSQHESDFLTPITTSSKEGNGKWSHLMQELICRGKKSRVVVVLWFSRVLVTALCQLSKKTLHTTTLLPAHNTDTHKCEVLSSHTYTGRVTVSWQVTHGSLASQHRVRARPLAKEVGKKTLYCCFCNGRKWSHCGCS